LNIGLRSVPGSGRKNAIIGYNNNNNNNNNNINNTIIIIIIIITITIIAIDKNVT